MTSAADDFDALFEEVAAQRNQAVTASASSDGMANTAPVASTDSMSQEAANGADIAPAADEENAADKPMYERLGNIVRLLHDSLRELGYDRSLSNVASEIQDAKGRLEYIGSLTEQAANKVLNAIDIGMPEQESISKSAKDMSARWDALFEGKMSVDEFKVLAADSRQFAAKAAESAELEKARLLDIMMAQDFQDITGQLIKKILTITHKAENELAQLLLDSAPAEVKAAMENKPAELMQGPSVPSTAMEQDEVDNLLADLGF